MGKIATGEEGSPYNKHGFGVFYRGSAPWGIANPEADGSSLQFSPRWDSITGCSRKYLPSGGLKTLAVAV